MSCGILELAYIRLSRQGKARYPFFPCWSCTCRSYRSEKGGNHRPLGVDGDEWLDWQEGDVLTNLMIKCEIRIDIMPKVYSLVGVRH
jgi:hypothetical protein